MKIYTGGLLFSGHTVETRLYDIAISCLPPHQCLGRIFPSMFIYQSNTSLNSALLSRNGYQVTSSTYFCTASLTQNLCAIQNLVITRSQRHLAKAAPNDPMHMAYTSHATDDLICMTDRLTPRTSVRIGTSHLSMQPNNSNNL